MSTLCHWFNVFWHYNRLFFKFSFLPLWVDQLQGDSKFEPVQDTLGGEFPVVFKARILHDGPPLDAGLLHMFYDVVLLGSIPRCQDYLPVGQVRGPKPESPDPKYGVLTMGQDGEVERDLLRRRISPEGLACQGNKFNVRQIPEHSLTPVQIVRRQHKDHFI